MSEKEAAKLGHAESQFNLGWMYSSGAGGIKRFSALAAKCYSQAVDQGLTVAQFNLGRAYHNGEGISQDFEKAVHWYSIAANKGHAMAQNTLRAVPCRKGGSRRLLARSKRYKAPLFKRFCSIAQNNLAIMFAHMGFDHFEGLCLAHRCQSKWNK